MFHQNIKEDPGEIFSDSTGESGMIIKDFTINLGPVIRIHYLARALASEN